MGMRKNFPAEKMATKRDAADVLRVRYWYEGVRQRTGLDTAYALEQHFEPESFSRRPSDGKPSHRCKWQRYTDGRHTPQTRLAEWVDARLPGSLQELRHPLWDVLKRKPARGTRNEAFLQRLKPDVLAVLYQPVDGIEVYWQRAAVTRVLIAKLERLASLDALAALVWLLYEALAQDNSKRAERLVRSIYAVLLMRGIWWQERQLAGPLLELFARRILPLSAPPHLHFGMSAEDLVKASTGLNLIVHHTSAGKRPGLEWRQRVRIMRGLLAGNTGLDVVHAMAPVYMPAPDEPDIPRTVLDDLLHQERLRAWGWACINSGRPEPFPPADVYKVGRR
ncbi:hypothetical protein [Pseudomonas sp. TCU-HL1]|uniref:hypothetical protein n=1 Tax=Pseudomonas sp. TCU-HL1 TaxID=1856685 RepID=UPI00083D4C3E|nr:hypothetical protein [Pseudomonas sp. TCU-HL1]AOE85917.1 hypothetical protein THL1_3369 [Pseudomonas sp. TCU-HL1]